MMINYLPPHFHAIYYEYEELIEINRVCKTLGANKYDDWSEMVIKEKVCNK